jgi:hypothetical protein
VSPAGTGVLHAHPHSSTPPPRPPPLPELCHSSATAIAQQAPGARPSPPSAGPPARLLRQAAPRASSCSRGGPPSYAAAGRAAPGGDGAQPGRVPHLLWPRGGRAGPLERLHHWRRLLRSRLPGALALAAAAPGQRRPPTPLPPHNHTRRSPAPHPPPPAPQGRHVDRLLTVCYLPSCLLLLAATMRFSKSLPTPRRAHGPDPSLW